VDFISRRTGGKINWSMIGHDRRHWKATSLTDHYFRARAWMRASQVKWDSADTGMCAHSIFPDVTLQL
jgi:hypothetical protein